MTGWAVEELERREYQVLIAEKASQANTLVVIPTGLGKTVIAIMVAEKRLAQLNDGKVVVLAPTRPLVIQHHTAFKNYFKDSPCSYLTGQIRPDERIGIWAESKFIFATPQVVANDVRAERYSLSDVCLMVFDEAHRCVKDYDYTELSAQVSANSLESTHSGLDGLTGRSNGTHTRDQPEPVHQTG